MESSPCFEAEDVFEDDVFEEGSVDGVGSSQLLGVNTLHTPPYYPPSGLRSGEVVVGEGGWGIAQGRRT